jgi:NADH-quinone oxidoreductase subunit M
MAARLKLLACFMVFFCLTSIGLPGLNGFVGEVLVLMGMFDSEMARGLWPTLAVIGATGIVLGAWYLLTMLQRVFFGPVREPGHAGSHHTFDLGLRELAALAPVALGSVLLGVYPQPLLNSVERDLGVVSALVKESQDGHQTASRPPSELVSRLPTTTSAKEQPSD